MGKYAGVQFNVFLVDGYNLIASMSEAVTMSKESISQQTNAFGATSEEHTPLNVEKGTLTVGGGFFDQATDALHGQVGSSQGVSRLICAAIEDNIIGKHFIGYEGAFDIKYELLDTRDGLVKANASYIISGDVNEGVIVQHLATFTADWDTKTGGAGAPDAPVDNALDLANRTWTITSNSQANPTVITTPINHGLTSTDVVYFTGSNSTPSINGTQVVTVTGPTTFTVPVNVTVAGDEGEFVKVQTTAGGVGYIQATAYTGFTGFIGKINHSVDDSTYAALVTFADFAAVAGPHKERIAVTGTVDRYLAFQGDVTGSGSVTVFAGFCRN